MPSVPPISASQCRLSVPVSAHQCRLLVPVSARQCRLTVSAISAVYQCHLSVAYECCMSMPPTSASSSVHIS
ncbi:unnamed protein product, partial [Staurois parvus]